MKNTLRLSLRPNEKIYLNGAVIRVDRKVSIELLNDVQFLLEQHVLQPYEANTPLKQLYFIVQIMLMNPAGVEEAREMFRRSLMLLLASFKNETILASLKHIDQLVAEDQVYEALKTIRALYRLEDDILHPKPAGEDRPLALAMAGA